MGEKIINWSREYFSNASKVIFILVLIIAGCTSLITDLRKEIVIVMDNGEVSELNIVTLRRNVGSILDSNNIIVKDKDKISVDLNSYASDGDVIHIKKALKVNVALEGKELEIYSAENNVKDLLKAENIELDSLDKISPSLNKELQEGMDVTIKRVKKEIKEVTEVIAYSREMKSSDEIEEGTQKVLQNGENGQKVIKTEVTYEDGKVIDEKIIEEKTEKEPVDELVAIGTLGVLRPSRGGKYNYTSAVEVKATSYTADVDHNGVPDDPYGGMTATGTRARRNIDGYSTIAVDPRIIPLGTKVYVEGYGLAIAEDVGGAIKGNIIDVYMDTYSQTMEWGVQYVKVYILKNG